jgi:hypothetical protein
MDIHCVVTGQNKSGKSVIIRDTPVQPIGLALLPGYEFHRLWGKRLHPRPSVRRNCIAASSLLPSSKWFPLRFFHYTSGCEDETRSTRRSLRSRRNSTEVAGDD